MPSDLIEGGCRFADKDMRPRVNRERVPVPQERDVLMTEQATLSRLIAGMYEATLEPEQWSEVLARIVAFVGGHGGCLLAKDPTSRDIEAHWHAGVEPRYLRLYNETYSKMGPVAALSFGEVGQIVSVPEVVPYDEFRRSRFYLEWAEPQGWVDVALAVLDKSAAGWGFLGISRNATNGMVDDEMRRRISLVVPHVRRALRIGRAMERRQADATTFADILDRLSAGLLLLDAQGRIVHTNAAADDMLRDGRLLRAIGRRLAGGDAQAERALRETAILPRAEGVNLGREGIVVPLRTCDGERYIARAMPLASTAPRGAGDTAEATTAVFVRRATMDPPPAPDIIAESYKLTPTELRVLFALVEIGGVPDVAASLGIAETTVKTHLGRLFAKTGARRQAELVKLVAGFSMPVTHRA
jgi:DNA-binding CsgD family transcriptional regulator/PAS domain-containing protein